MARGPASPPPPGEAALDVSLDRRALWMITLAALVVRLVFLLLEPSVDPVADERVWAKSAQQVCHRSFSPLRTNLLLFHPPVYPYFLAVPLCLTGSLAVAKGLQVLLGVLLVPAVGHLGARLMGARAGLLAAGLAAFYPELVWLSAHFWVESLFAVLLWWSFERLLAADQDRRLRTAAVAGALWGLAILARETFLYFVPVAAVWLGLRRQRGGRRALAFAFTTLLVVAPWTYRNWRVFHAFVPVSTAGGLNLFQGNARLSRQEVYDLYFPIEGLVAQHRYALRMGLAAIRERQPAWAFEKLRDQMPMFWEAESMALIHVKRGAYGPPRPGTAMVVAAVMLVPYLAVLALFVAGLIGTTWDRRRALLLAFLVYYNAIHVITHGFNRYRLPVMPVLFVFGGWAWQAWRARQYPPLDLRRKVLAGLLLVFFALCLVPSLRTQIRHPVFSGGAPEAPEAPPPEDSEDAGSSERAPSR